MSLLSPLKLASLVLLPSLLTTLGILKTRPNAPTAPPVASSYTIHGCALPLNPPLVPSHSPDGYPNEVTNIQGPSHGTISRPNAYNASYCPNYGYVGEDSFSYTVCELRPEGQSCATGTATLNVVNQAPNGGADFYNVHGTTVIGPFLSNDSDPDGDSMTCGDSQHECIINFPQHGSLFGLPQPDKKSYTPAAGYTGPDSFSYNACDSLGLCVPTTITLSVNNGAPTASNHHYRIQGSTIIGPLLQGATDPEGDALQLGDGGTFPSHGQLFGTATPDLKIYNPFAGFVGTDSYTYQVCDNFGACSPLATITLSVIGDGSNDGAIPCQSVGEPINVTSGNMYLQQPDYSLSVAGPPIEIVRTYNSNSQRIGLFGRGWSTVYDETIVAYDSNLLRLNEADGRATYFARPVNSSGAFSPLHGDYHGSITSTGNGFTLTMMDGSSQSFDSAGKLLAQIDRDGNQTTLTYDTNGRLTLITNPFGRTLTVTPNGNGRVTSISDSLGTVATYTYGGGSQLLSVTYADNSAFNFSYDGNFRLTSVTDALGNIVEAHTYDSQGRALTSEKHGGVERYTLTYVNSTHTNVTDALGRVTKYTFDTTKSRNILTQVEGICGCGAAHRYKPGLMTVS